MVLSGQALIAVELDGRVGRPEMRPGKGKVRLCASEPRGRCFLFDESGESWSIEPDGSFRVCGRFPAGMSSLLVCSVPQQYLAGFPDRGYAYYRDGKERHTWPEATAGGLSYDGHFIAVTLPGKVEVYQDPK
jgi:hypothetical protein